MQATSKIVLGTVQFGLSYGINNQSGKPSQIEVNKVLDLAFDNNIRLLDSAEAYGNAHEVIGEYHQNSTIRFEIISKYHASRADLPSDIHQRVHSLLSTLHVDHLYGYMFHNYKDYAQLKEELLPPMKKLKTEGKIHRIGVSLYTNQEFASVIEDDSIDMIQLPFNMLDNNTLRGELLRKAKERGKEIHTRSVFLQGLFFKKVETFSEKLNPLKKYIQTLREISIQHNTGIGEMALNYAVQQPLIDHVLIGVDNAMQLKENLSLLERRWNTATMRAIDALAVNETELLNPANWN